MPTHPPRVSGAVIAVIIGVLFGFFAIVIVAIAYSPRGFDSNATPVVTTLGGIVVLGIPILINLLRTDQTRQELQNGLITDKVHDAVATGVQEGTLPIKEDRARNGVRERATDRDANPLAGGGEPG